MSRKPTVTLPEAQDAMVATWRYLRACANVDGRVVRDRGIEPARAARMREWLRSLQVVDRGAYYAVVSEDYSQAAGRALVLLVQRFVEDRTGFDLEESTQPGAVVIPPEAIGGDE